jgi:hypothetical protein
MTSPLILGFLHKSACFRQALASQFKPLVDRELPGIMYAPVSSNTQASRDASLELNDQEGFESNLRCAGVFALGIVAIVIANFFLNQLSVASSTAIHTANYAVFTQRVSTALHFSVFSLCFILSTIFFESFFSRFQTFEMYDNLMTPLVADMETVLEFLPGTLVFRNDSCVTSGVCANSNFTPMAQTTFAITFSASGPLVTGHLWNLNFQAQTVSKWSGMNSLPSCPSIITCTMGA